MNDRSEKLLFWKWFCDRIIVRTETMGTYYQLMKVAETASDRRK